MLSKFVPISPPRCLSNAPRISTNVPPCVLVCLAKSGWTAFWRVQKTSAAWCCAGDGWYLWWRGRVSQWWCHASDFASTLTTPRDGTDGSWSDGSICGPARCVSGTAVGRAFGGTVFLSPSTSPSHRRLQAYSKAMSSMVGCRSMVDRCRDWSPPSPGHAMVRRPPTDRRHVGLALLHPTRRAQVNANHAKIDTTCL